MSDVLKPLIGTAANRPLTRAEAEAAFNALFQGEGTPAQMGGFLMALRTRGETVDEYAAAARRIELLNVKEAAARSKADEGKASELDMTTDDGASQVVDSTDTRRMIIIEACVVGWFGMRRGAAEAEFTTDALRRLLALRPLWVRKISDAIEDGAKFMQG